MLALSRRPEDENVLQLEWNAKKMEAYQEIDICKYVYAPAKKTTFHTRPYLKQAKQRHWTKATVGGVPPFSLMMCLSQSHE